MSEQNSGWASPTCPEIPHPSVSASGVGTFLSHMLSCTCRQGSECDLAVNPLWLSDCFKCGKLVCELMEGGDHVLPLLVYFTKDF